MQLTPYDSRGEEAGYLNLKPVLQLDVACMAVGDGFATEGIYHVVLVKAQEPMLVKLLAD